MIVRMWDRLNRNVFQLTPRYYNKKQIGNSVKLQNKNLERTIFYPEEKIILQGNVSLKHLNSVGRSYIHSSLRIIFPSRRRSPI